MKQPMRRAPKVAFTSIIAGMLALVWGKRTNGQADREGNRVRLYVMKRVIFCRLVPGPGTSEAGPSVEGRISHAWSLAVIWIFLRPDSELLFDCLIVNHIWPIKRPVINFPGLSI